MQKIKKNFLKRFGTHWPLLNNITLESKFSQTKDT